jgi:Gpi18-like mannosyltransferase
MLILFRFSNNYSSDMQFKIPLLSIINRSNLQSTANFILKRKIRFFIPIIILGIFKLHASIWVYTKSLRDGILQLPQIGVLGAIEPQWLYIFSAWDTSWYITLAKSYTFARTFFPGYPFLIRFLDYFMNNYWLSAFIISISLGFISLPIFQAIAEEYMEKSEAFCGTIIMSFFPYVFVFTTVSYSESLFLLAVLATWYFYLKNRILFASVCSIVATLTKLYGILIILPILADLLLHRKWKKATIALASPILILAIIIPLFPQKLLERIVLEMNAATWTTSTEYFGTFWFKDYLTSIFTAAHPTVFFNFYQAFALAFIALVGYLVINSTRMDWRLGFYSIVMFVVIILFGFVNGLPRYLSFIFPMWLVIKTKDIVTLVMLVLLFYMHSLILWYEFLWTMYPI